MNRFLIGEPAMNTSSNEMLRGFVRVFPALLFVVASLVFVSVPYVLGHHPGEVANSVQVLERHTS